MIARKHKVGGRDPGEKIAQAVSELCRPTGWSIDQLEAEMGFKPEYQRKPKGRVKLRVPERFRFADLNADYMERAEGKREGWYFMVGLSRTDWDPKTGVVSKQWGEYLQDSVEDSHQHRETEDATAYACFHLKRPAGKGGLSLEVETMQAVKIEEPCIMWLSPKGLPSVDDVARKRDELRDLGFPCPGGVLEIQYKKPAGTCLYEIDVITRGGEYNILLEDSPSEPYDGPLIIEESERASFGTGELTVSETSEAAAGVKPALKMKAAYQRERDGRFTVFDEQNSFDVLDELTRMPPGPPDAGDLQQRIDNMRRHRVPWAYRDRMLVYGALPFWIAGKLGVDTVTFNTEDQASKIYEAVYKAAERAKPEGITLHRNKNCDPLGLYEQ